MIMLKNKDKRKNISSAKSNDELSTRSPEFKKLINDLRKSRNEHGGIKVSFEQFKKDLAAL